MILVPSAFRLGFSLMRLPALSQCRRTPEYSPWSMISGSGSGNAQLLSCSVHAVSTFHFSTPCVMRYALCIMQLCIVIIVIYST